MSDHKDCKLESGMLPEQHDTDQQAAALEPTGSDYKCSTPSSTMAPSMDVNHLVQAIMAQCSGTIEEQRKSHETTCATMNRMQEEYLASTARMVASQQAFMRSQDAMIAQMCDKMAATARIAFREEQRAIKGFFDTHEESLAVYGCRIDQEIRRQYPRLLIPYEINIRGRHNPGTAIEVLAAYSQVVLDAEETLRDLVKNPIPDALLSRLEASAMGQQILFMVVSGVSDLRDDAVGRRMAFVFELRRVRKKATREALLAMSICPKDDTFISSMSLERVLAGGPLHSGEYTDPSLTLSNFRLLLGNQ
eukprot:PhM_4_TR8289/c3_g3_i1/m.92572